MDTLFSMEKPSTIRHNIKQCLKAINVQRHELYKVLDDYALHWKINKGKLSKKFKSKTIYRLRKRMSRLKKSSIALAEHRRSLEIMGEKE